MADEDFVGIAKEKDVSSRRGRPFSADLHREYTRTWLVRTNDPHIGADMVCEAPGIPAPFSPYVTEDGKSFDLKALLVSLDAEHYEDRKYWLVTGQYSTRMPEGGPPEFVLLGRDVKGAQNNPELVPPVFRWDSDEVSRALPYDLDGKPFVNAAGQPFSPAPMFEAGRGVLLISRNELNFGRRRMTDYSFAVNSDVFMGVKPGCVRSKVTAEEAWLGSLPYWRVHYRLTFGAPKHRQIPVGGVEVGGPAAAGAAAGDSADDELEPWQPEILNAGTMRRQNNPGLPFHGQVMPIYRGATPVSQPVCLDRNGDVVPLVDGRINPTYLPFRVYKRMPFTKLLENSLRKLL